jgi:hypothetical protein
VEIAIDTSSLFNRIWLGIAAGDTFNASCAPRMTFPGGARSRMSSGRNCRPKTDLFPR